MAGPGGRGKPVPRARAVAVRALRAGSLALALAALLAPAPAAAQLPPDEDWRTIRTAHFRVTFPARIETLARRAGARAELAWAELAGALPEPSVGTVDLVLTDHVDASNGFASLAPHPRIVLYARPPVDGSSLSYFDDWMELVVTHELAHVFHLDVTGPLGRLLRSVFGRLPAPWPFFPQFGTPGWVIEGLATHYETALTPSGRGAGTHHEMLLRTAALEGALEGIDAASGQSPVWPAGDRAYVYGSRFFEWLLARRDRMARFVEAVGGQWVPYRLNAAARDAFDVSFSDAWEEWTGALEADAEAFARARAARAPLTVTEAITRGARQARDPRVAPDGTLAYARADGRSDAHVRLVAADGSDGRALVRTNGLAAFSFAPDGTVVLAQLDFVDPYRLYGDLYRVDRTGATTRLTRGARLDRPVVTPDGAHAVAIRDRDGTTDLVRVVLASGAVSVLAAGDVDVHWGLPAVSPGGRWVAASRWAGGRADLVVLGAEGGPPRPVTDDRAVDLSPTFSPDGRWLVWSSDRSGVANLLAVPFDPATGRTGTARQLTNLLTGAASPAVDPAGRWLYASIYHADGWDVERLPFAPDEGFEPFALDPRFAPPAPAPPAPPVTAPARAYSPWPTLRPGYWEPLFREARRARLAGGTVELIGPSFGLATGATDVVGLHEVGVAARLSTDGRLEGALGWGWNGLGLPLLRLSGAQEWDAAGPLLGRRDPDRPDTLFQRERERRVTLAATVPLRRVRTAGSLTLSAGLIAEDRFLLDRDLAPSEAYAPARPTRRLGEARAAASLSSVRGHAFSVSPEQGAAALVQARVRRELEMPDGAAGDPERDGSFEELLGRVLFHRPLPTPGFARSVLALRVSGGAAQGPGADRFHFDVGGANGASDPVTGLLGGASHFLPVRGFASGERSGRYAWSASGEVRFPLALVHRGLGLFPLYLDRVSGSLFADAGDGWGPGPRAGDPLLSVGAELSAELLAFFQVPLPLRVGFAVPLGADVAPSVHVRVGRSF